MRLRLSCLREMRRIRSRLRSRYPFIDQMANIVDIIGYRLTDADRLEVKPLTDEVWSRRPFDSSEGFSAHESVYVPLIGRPFYNSFARYFVLWDDPAYPVQIHDEGTFLDILCQWGDEDIQPTVAERWSQYQQQRREWNVYIPEPAMVAELRRDVNLERKEIVMSWTFYTPTGILPPSYSASARRRRQKRVASLVQAVYDEAGLDPKEHFILF